MPGFTMHAYPSLTQLCSLHSSCEKLRPSHTSMEVGGQGREREKRERAAWTGTPRGRVLNAAGESVHHLGVDPLPPSAFSPPCSIGTRMIEEQKGFVSLWTVDRFYRRQTSSLRGHMDVSKVTHEQMVTPKLWTWLSLQSHMLAVARQ